MAGCNGKPSKCGTRGKDAASSQHSAQRLRNSTSPSLLARHGRLLTIEIRTRPIFAFSSWAT
eukprot:8390127-Lingulodinium_polyedra.AAC.1